MGGGVMEGACLLGGCVLQSKFDAAGSGLHAPTTSKQEHACVVCLRAACLQVCTNKMNLGDEVDLEDYVSRPDKISAAEISAICQEAGMHAVSRLWGASRAGHMWGGCSCVSAAHAVAAEPLTMHVLAACLGCRCARIATSSCPRTLRRGTRQT